MCSYSQVLFSILSFPQNVSRGSHIIFGTLCNGIDIVMTSMGEGSNIKLAEELEESMCSVLKSFIAR